MALLPGEKEKLEKTRNINEMMREEIKATMAEYIRKKVEHGDETTRPGMGSVIAHPPSPVEEGAEEGARAGGVMKLDGRGRGNVVDGELGESGK